MKIIKERKKERKRQCVYNVISRRDFVPVFVEKQQVLYILSVCVCRLSYLACKVHAGYCHLWPLLLYQILSHYLINGTIFEKKRKEKRK